MITHATNNANITWYCINCSKIPVLVTWMHFYASISPSCVCVYGLFSWPFMLSISIDFGWLFKDRQKVDNSILNFKIATSENTKRHHRVQKFWTCGKHRLDVRTVPQSIFHVLFAVCDDLSRHVYLHVPKVSRAGKSCMLMKGANASPSASTMAFGKVDHSLNLLHGWCWAILNITMTITNFPRCVQGSPQ